MKITKDDFNAYEKIRESGVTNMFDYKVVSRLSDLSSHKVIQIIKNYSELKEKFKNN